MRHLAQLPIENWLRFFGALEKLDFHFSAWSFNHMSPPPSAELPSQLRKAYFDKPTTWLLMTLLALPESIDWDLLKHLLDNFAPKILDDESFDHLNPNRFAEPLQAWLKEQRADQDYGITVTLLAYAKFDFLADELDHMEKNLPQLSDELLLGYMPALLRQRFTSQSVLQHAIKLFRHETSRKNIASTLFKVRADLPEPASLDAETEKLYLEFNRERAQSISQIEDWEQERYLRPFVSRLDIDTLKKNLPLVENFQTREMIN